MEYKKITAAKGYISEYDKGYQDGSKDTAELNFNTIIKALEMKKASIIAYYAVKESVDADIAIRIVKELAKQRGIKIKGVTL